MATFAEVDPTTFVKTAQHQPPAGRGAWTRTGIGFDWRPRKEPEGEERIGTVAEKSLDHWAVAAGVASVQLRLQALNYGAFGDGELGIFGPKTDAAVKAFQAENVDPQSGLPLTVDGIFGSGDARALWTPVLNRTENRYAIPSKFLRGNMNWESLLDVGCVGYFIYYGEDLEYRGVDRGVGQINSKYQPQVTWREAYDAPFAIDWAGKRLRSQFNAYRDTFDDQKVAVLWDAAICAHNNPSAGLSWARNGVPPHQQAADYVRNVKEARY